MDEIWNCYNLKSTKRIYMFGILKCSEKFKVLDIRESLIWNVSHKATEMGRSSVLHKNNTTYSFLFEGFNLWKHVLFKL